MGGELPRTLGALSLAWWRCARAAPVLHLIHDPWPRHLRISSAARDAVHDNAVQPWFSLCDRRQFCLFLSTNLNLGGLRRGSSKTCRAPGSNVKVGSPLHLELVIPLPETARAVSFFLIWTTKWRYENSTNNQSIELDLSIRRDRKTTDDSYAPSCEHCPLIADVAQLARKRRGRLRTTLC
ncbi:hypothetical protein B0T16DRAFT_228355 [Cercophora newfieldiana]|uniref:Secreted protein n=1 Tax=Cercophora newfieldiana TaxID=92897 RepID=A0AA39XR99_9PEZI|nr:hypothetical protein B0T16DRAFT_228355 [Cercophora newfieldiana]